MDSFQLLSHYYGYKTFTCLSLHHPIQDLPCLGKKKKAGFSQAQKNTFFFFSSENTDSAFLPDRDWVPDTSSSNSDYVWAYETSGDLVKMQILIQWVWGGAWYVVCIASNPSDAAGPHTEPGPK